MEPKEKQPNQENNQSATPTVPEPDLPSSPEQAPTTDTAPKMFDLLMEGWQFVKQRKDVVTWYVVLLILLTVLSSEWIVAMNNIWSFVATLATFVVLIFVVMNSWGIMYAVAQSDPYAVTYKQAFDWSAKHFLQLLWTSVLSGLAAVLGFFLLIIPGIIVTVYLYFSLYAVALGDGYGTKALKRSYSDIKGRWWTVATQLLILGLWLLVLYIVIGLVFGLATVVGGEDTLTLVVSEALIAGVGGVVGVMSMYALAQYYKYLREHPLKNSTI